MRILLTVLWTTAAVHAQDSRIKIDNDQVRVINAVSAPHVKTPMHEHQDNRVMVYLDAGSQTLTDPSGKSTESHWKAGEVMWSPGGGLHISENTGDKPFRVVEVEIKRRPGPASAATEIPELDPVRIDPKHYRVVLENDQVRVVRSRYGPNESGLMHEHGAHRVVVYLTDQMVKATLPDGSIQQVRGTAGEIRWAGATQHQEENLSGQAFEVLSIDLK